MRGVRDWWYAGDKEATNVGAEILSTLGVRSKHELEHVANAEGMGGRGAHRFDSAHLEMLEVERTGCDTVVLGAGTLIYGG